MNFRPYPLFPFILLCSVLLSLTAQAVKAQIPSMRIADISFEGNQGISTQKLKMQLSRSRQGALYVAENLKADLLQLEEAYKAEGFLRVKIPTPEVQVKQFDAGEGVAIRIRVEEGPRYITGKSSVKNAQVLGPDALMQMCPLQKGQPYRRGLFVQWQGLIQEAYSSLGHIRARCDVHESVNDAEKTVDFTLDCVEGKPYNVGKITIIGDESIDRAKFKRRLLLSEGRAFNPENLILSIQFLNQAGLYKPMSNSDVGMAIDDSNGIVDLTFHLSPLK